MINDNKAKPKNQKFRPRNGCITVFLLLLSFPIMCFTSLWLFAHFGGEWAASTSLPVPPNSEIRTTHYEYGYSYIIKTILYTNSSTSEELREWFVEMGVGMTPIPLNMEGTSFIDYDEYYGIPESPDSLSPIQEFHYLASFFTHAWWEDYVPSCQDIRVYKEVSFASIDYPDQNFSTVVSIFTLTTCWAAN